MGRLGKVLGAAFPLTAGPMAMFQGSNTTPQQATVPTLFGNQVPIMAGMANYLKDKIGRPASAYSDNPYVKDFQDKYGDWDKYIRGRVETTYDPQSVLNTYDRGEYQASQEVDPRIAKEYSGQGMEGYKQAEIKRQAEDRVAQKDTALYQNDLARKQALYAGLKMTPQALQTLEQMDQKYSDPTKSAEWETVKKLLGLDTQSSATWQQPARDSAFMTAAELGSSVLAQGYKAKPGTFFGVENLFDPNRNFDQYDLTGVMGES